MKHQPRVPNKLFAETQMGIVTRFGDWFHVTGDQIDEYVPGLIEKVDLHDLVKAAQAWVKSADSLSMVLILLLLYVINPFAAAAITVLFHLVWFFNKSSFIVLPFSSFLDILYQDGTQLVMSLVALSFLGIQGYYLAGGIGLIFFFLLKLGLLKRLWDKLYESFDGSGLTLNDRVMKMVIIRHAMREDVAPDEVQQMEQNIMDMASGRRKKK